VDVFVLASEFSGADALRGQVRRWERLGIAGVLIPDHLFVTNQAGQATEQPDPIVLLSAIGALSPALKIGTIVANISLAHPALTLRHFAQLATLFGGDRVLAGLGAGWNTEEFGALGMAMPSHAERVERLGEAVRLARTLFSDGVATVTGSSVVTRGLPLSPRPAIPPRLLLGGGSDLFLTLAGEYADWADLNGSSRRLKLGQRAPAVGDGIRRLTTTVADLEESVRVLRTAARQAGRPPGTPQVSVLIDTIEFCAASEVGEREERLRQARGVTEAAVDQCPYVFIGPAGRMREALAERQERLGLSAVIIIDRPELDRFMPEVAATLA
jgi:alkanesulfonate monooxygenase SsuD/methylene tetrahydromethanopterin reductase-like flavin-dependent oxidoreductase (luciferase family)